MSKRGGISWFFGLIMGAIVGILFAPRKGAEFRKRIQDARAKGKLGHEPLMEDLKKMGTDIKDTAVELYEGSELENLVDESKEKVHEFSDEMIGDVKKKAHHLKQQLKKEFKGGK